MKKAKARPHYLVNPICTFEYSLTSSDQKNREDLDRPGEEYVQSREDIFVAIFEYAIRPRVASGTAGEVDWAA